MDLQLKPDKERSVRNGHPWIFSGALQPRQGSAIDPGSVVRVLDSRDAFVAAGYYNPRTGIAVRVLSLQDEAIDEAFFARRVTAALDLRRAILPPRTNAYRLLNGEGDFLPGFVVDVYGPILVMQCLTAGAAKARSALVSALVAALQPIGIFERSLGSVRREEGLGQEIGVLYGNVPEDPIEIEENGLKFFVDVRAGQKTGFFVDQRSNRMLIRDLAGGRSVLNAFAYTGAFSVYAATGGASRVLSIESSAGALALAERNWQANGLDADIARFVDADVFRYLRDSSESFDLMVLDPPALAKHRHEVDAAARAYKDLHIWATKRAAKGALIATFTCSQHVPLDIFVRAVSSGANDAKRRVQILQQLGPGADHPRQAFHPEAEYLRGLLLRVS